MMRVGVCCRVRRGAVGYVGRLGRPQHGFDGEWRGVHMG